MMTPADKIFAGAEARVNDRRINRINNFLYPNEQAAGRLMLDQIKYMSAIIRIAEIAKRRGYADIMAICEDATRRTK